MIAFTGEHKFLSNFYPVQIEFEGIIYPTVEHAYQAAKTPNDETRQWISTLSSPGLAKKAGRSLFLREDWDDVKLPIMAALLRKKFYRPELKLMLLGTLREELVEINYWHDQFWGNCICRTHENIPGENWLGKLLMEQRKVLEPVG